MNHKVELIMADSDELRLAWMKTTQKEQGWPRLRKSKPTLKQNQLRLKSTPIYQVGLGAKIFVIKPDVDEPWPAWKETLF